MLKVECPQCKEWIYLPFKSDEQETRCPHCSQMIPIKDVYISAGPYLIYREVLMKNMFKYKRLLAEAEKEISGLEKSGNRAFEISAQTLGVFVNHLKELLSGCRNDLRHPVIDDLTAEYILNGGKYKGKIKNLSVTGVCIDAGRNVTMAGLWNEIELKFYEHEESIRLNGRIMWIRYNLMGIKFGEQDSSAGEFIRKYIMGNSLLTRGCK